MKAHLQQNLNQAFRSLLLSTSVALSFVPVAGAVPIVVSDIEEKLPCCTGTACPITKNIEGEPGVTYTVKFKGIVVPFKEGNEVLTQFESGPERLAWLRSTYKKMAKDKGGLLRDIHRNAQIYMRCSGANDPSDMTQEKERTCPPGEGVEIEDLMKCFGNVNPYAQIEIIATRDDDSDIATAPPMEEGDVAVVVPEFGDRHPDVNPVYIPSDLDRGDYREGGALSAAIANQQDLNDLARRMEELDAEIDDRRAYGNELQNEIGRRMENVGSTENDIWSLWERIS